jgi:hypothetical protein
LGQATCQCWGDVGGRPKQKIKVVLGKEHMHEESEHLEGSTTCVHARKEITGRKNNMHMHGRKT